MLNSLFLPVHIFMEEVILTLYCCILTLWMVSYIEWLISKNDLPRVCFRLHPAYIIDQFVDSQIEFTNPNHKSFLEHHLRQFFPLPVYNGFFSFFPSFFSYYTTLLYVTLRIFSAVACGLYLCCTISLHETFKISEWKRTTYSFWTFKDYI